VALVPLAEPALTDARALHIGRPAFGRVASAWAAHLNHLAGAQFLTAFTHVVDTDSAVIQASQSVSMRVLTAGLCNALWVRIAYMAFEHVVVPAPSIAIAVTGDAGFTWQHPTTLAVAGDDEWRAWSDANGNVLPMVVRTPWRLDPAKPAVPRLLAASPLATTQIDVDAENARIHSVTVVQVYQESI